MAIRISKETLATLKKGMGVTDVFFSQDKKLQPSFIVMGEKGSGKTYTTITTFTGTMLILSFDNQTEIILQNIANKEKKKYGKSPTEERVVVANFFPSEYGHVQGSGDERRLNVGMAIITDIEKMFENMRTHNIHFDHIVIDGFPELKDRINEYIRKKGGLTLSEPILGEDLIVYGYRKRFFQILVSSMFELSDICPVFTTYPKPDFSKAFRGSTLKEPEFDQNLKWEFRNILRVQKTEENGKNKQIFRYYVIFDSMKATDFGEEGTVVEITGGKPAISPEKLEAYRKGNPMNEIKVPRIEISSDNTDDEKDDDINPDTVFSTISAHNEIIKKEENKKPEPKKEEKKGSDEVIKKMEEGGSEGTDDMDFFLKDL
jgi:hypothetical protein